ncbi:MAG TPA: hypothetical protein IAC31_01815 [Candidatus Faecousia intestinigallinarum]|nr:hypothetical protein [Candidatus Faecousia intestinigallinarum]
MCPDDCGKSCAGRCGGCSGCAAVLELTQGEIDILELLGQFPFLPVARKADAEQPVFLESQDHSPEEYSRILQCLEKKNLISIDYTAPLKGCSYQAYQGFPIHGSIALTQRGQTVIELLQIQGFTS